ncbi:hypothetical protein V8C42DRAFT_238217 [Trichoderma barbatum]
MFNPGSREFTDSMGNMGRDLRIEALERRVIALEVQQNTAPADVTAQLTKINESIERLDWSVWLAEHDIKNIMKLLGEYESEDSDDSEDENPQTMANNGMRMAQHPHAAHQHPHTAHQHPHAADQQPHVTAQQPLATAQQPHATAQQPHINFQEALATFQRAHDTLQRAHDTLQRARTTVQQSPNDQQARANVERLQATVQQAMSSLQLCANTMVAPEFVYHFPFSSKRLMFFSLPHPNPQQEATSGQTHQQLPVADWSFDALPAYQTQAEAQPPPQYQPATPNRRV